jgi:hypothetical protein
LIKIISVSVNFCLSSKKRILNSESLHEVPTQVIVVLLEFDFRGVYCLLDVF